MHRGGIQQLLERRACQPQVPTLPEINAPGAWRETPLHPRPQGVLGSALGSLLPLACRLERLMVDLWADRQLAGSRLGGGAGTADGTRATGGPVKPEAKGGITRDIVSKAPVDPAMALRTVRPLGRPIDDQGLEVIAFPLPPLPAVGPKRRTDHSDLMLGVGSDEEVRIDIAAVEHVDAGEHITSGEVLLEGGAHDTILRGGRCRHHWCQEIGMAGIAGLGEVDCRAHPVSLALTTGAGLEIIGRRNAHRGRRLRSAGAPAQRFTPRGRTAIIRLEPHPPPRLQGRELPHTYSGVRSPHPVQKLIAVRPDLAGARCALTRILRPAGLVRPEAVAGIPLQGHRLLHPGGSHITELIQGPRPGFEDAFYAVQCADRRQDMGGSGALRTTRLDPAPCVAGGQEGLEAPLARLMGEPAVATIVPPREVNAGVRQLKAEGILPIQAAADGIGGLAVGASLDVWHDHHQRETPGCDFDGTPLGWIAIGTKLIIIECAELGPELHRAVALGKGDLHGSRGRRRYGGRDCRRQLMSALLARSSP